MSSFPGLRNQRWTQDTPVRDVGFLVWSIFCPEAQNATINVMRRCIQINRYQSYSTLRKVAESRAAGMSCFTRWQAMWLMQHSSYWFMATDHSELAKGRTGANSFARVDDHFLTPFCGAQLFKMELYVFSTSDAVVGLNTYHEIIRSEQKFDIVPWQSTISYTRWVAERLLSL